VSAHSRSRCPSVRRSGRNWTPPIDFSPGRVDIFGRGPSWNRTGGGSVAHLVEIAAPGFRAKEGGASHPPRHGDRHLDNAAHRPHDVQHHRGHPLSSKREMMVGNAQREGIRQGQGWTASTRGRKATAIAKVARGARTLRQEGGWDRRKIGPPPWYQPRPAFIIGGLEI